MDNEDWKKFWRILAELLFKPAFEILARSGLAVIPVTILWHLLTPSLGVPVLPFWKVHELLILLLILSKMLSFR